MQFTKNRTLAAKGVAILLLLAYHLFENGNIIADMNVKYGPLGLEPFLLITGFGNICVAVFVFLSAYGIAKGLLAAEKFDARKAYKQAAKRFLKLMTNFFVLYVSVCLLWFYKFDFVALYGGGIQGLLYMLTDATGLSAFFGTPNLNMTWWYMEIAYILVFLVPFLVWVVRKIGYPVILIALFLPAIISFDSGVERYLITAVLGVCAAYGNWFEHLMAKKVNVVFKWLVAAGGLVLCVLVRQNFAVREHYLHIVEAPIALFLVWVAGVLLGAIPVLSKVLEFIGKHSMNIYLVHTFFYMILWRNEIYRFQYAGLIFLVLLVVSLGYSVVLEAIKGIAIKLSKKLPVEKWRKIQ